MIVVNYLIIHIRNLFVRIFNKHFSLRYSDEVSLVQFEFLNESKY